MPTIDDNDVANLFPMPMRFVLGAVEPGARRALCCPLCESQVAYLLRVVVRQGHTRTVVTREATSVNASPRHLMWPGSRVELTFLCGAKHRFVYEFKFSDTNTSCWLGFRNLEPTEVFTTLWERNVND